MKSRRRWRWRWQHRRFALGLGLYTLLLLLLVSSLLDYGAKRGRAGEEEEELPPPPLLLPRRCPSLEEALGGGGGWSWQDEQQQPPAPAAAAARGGEDPGGGGGGDDGAGNGTAGGEGAPGSRAGGKRHLYVHATWRTGSSFLGELFNQHPDVFYLYEPMWHLWQALYPGDALSLQGALRDMMRSLFRCDFSAVGLIDGAACERRCPPRGLRELEAECRKYPVVVIKDVRLLELGALLPLLRDPELDLRVIQLFRDPRAVHNSRLKAKQALLRESIQPRAEFFLGGALEVICQGWLRDVLWARGAPAWLRARYAPLRYEDLVREPRAQLRRLLRFADLPAPGALEDFALNMTRGGAYSSERPFLISARDAREAVHAWRERLSRDQVRQVEAACGEAMRLLGYPLSGGGERREEAARGRPSAPPNPGSRVSFPRPLPSLGAPPPGPAQPPPLAPNTSSFAFLLGFRAIR
ncbi:hypothetical protein JRQ81_019177 [Phrynocephalus forsythii]|uniref:Sulfotransferase n=1 Tax=Phrynocephalus forsythii TaxID=171643 RepID=A0A9Q0XLJ7_9SAUR|nr:hypothetical protein JRQ81_019177 [Phrynocephalus forsythii]